MTLLAEPAVRPPAESSHDGSPSSTDGYGQGHDRPLRGYAKVMVTYGAVVGTAGFIARRRGVRLPERIGPYDLAVLALATHRLAALVSKDAVTSPLRAPFTQYEGAAGAGQLNEQVRGKGLRHAVGELLTCPFCLSQWVATSLVMGTVFAPRITRLVASAFAAVDAAHFLQFGWAKAQQATAD
jgi:hypothetical protein